MYLQSYAPVIPSGQGGSRPIDASLGSAAMTVRPRTVHPAAGGRRQQPRSGADRHRAGAAVQLRGRRVARSAPTPSPARCRSARCCRPASAAPRSASAAGGRPPTRSRPHHRPAAADAAAHAPRWSGARTPRRTTRTATRVDLALFSRDPNLASHALERSTTLNNQLTSIWGGLCTPVAPPACVLWTFCGQRLGPSDRRLDADGPRRARSAGHEPQRTATNHSAGHRPGAGQCDRSCLAPLVRCLGSVGSSRRR